MKTLDIAWLAGLLEGEGSFDIQRRASEHRHDKPRIQLNMTDSDIVQRAATLFGKRVNGPYGPYGKAKNIKPLYKTSVTGRRAAEWMLTLYTLLGQRRRKQIETALVCWRTNKCRTYNLNTQKHCF